MTHFQKNFPYTPTADQLILFKEIEQFIQDNDPLSMFVLKGFAGTGKTTVLSALVKSLSKFGLKSVLLAPTGRAAKVISNYSGFNASTIHKKIYRQSKSKDQSTYFQLIENKHTNTIFIVDESSMISNKTAEQGLLKFGNDGLLNDLISFVYESNTNCRIMFVGDTAQLPPIGLDESPALDAEFLKKEYDFKIYSYELKEVVRQSQASGILANATQLREHIQENTFSFPKIITKNYKDIYAIQGEKLEDGLNYAHQKFGIENTLVITRSNKNANLYNSNIRSRILYQEDEIAVNDFLMVVKNNYFWLPENAEAGFIANGDSVQVKKIRGTKEMYGLRFMDVSLQLIDYPNEPEFDCKIMLDIINLDGPSMPFAESKKFYDLVMEDYTDVPRKSEKIKLLKENPYYNALQVKFAYAVTCHKAQGGQWKAVFVDHGYLTEEMMNRDFLRWLYTSFSRATEELFLVNFDKRFFN